MTEYPNWFEYVQPNFEEFLLPLKDREYLRFLQLGVYTGDASVWMLENIFTSPSSILQDVDTWQGSNEKAHETIDFEKVYGLYLSRIREHDNLYHYRTTTLDFLINHRSEQFDFIYIDADHTTVGVLLDAELSWPLLKSGGIMAFDDYTWGHDSGDPRLAPQVGIDLFLHRHELDYQLLTKNHQVWIRKR